jgi:hypothetical protein
VWEILKAAGIDAVFQSEEIDIRKTAPRANAHCERIIQTLRHELCDHVLILNEVHARQLLATYQDHYNYRRPAKPEANDAVPRGAPTTCSPPGRYLAIHPDARSSLQQLAAPGPPPVVAEGADRLVPPPNQAIGTHPRWRIVTGSRP